MIRRMGLLFGILVVMSTMTVDARPVATASLDDDLTAIWQADDGGMYYLRQVDTTIWWAGFSSNSFRGVDDFHRGLNFTNVFQGTVRRVSGPGQRIAMIEGQWADVPKGSSLQQGTLTLEVLSVGIDAAPAGVMLRKVSQTGGFGGTNWYYFGRDTVACDFFCRFRRVQRNDGSFIPEHLTPYKDNAIAFGRVTRPPLANFPGDGSGIERSYARFMCADKGADDHYKWFDGGWGSDPPDGDIHFDIFFYYWKLDTNPSPSWIRNPDEIRAWMRTHDTLHAELGMYHRDAGWSNCVGNVPTLLPGWMEPGANSVLLNGRPIDGNVPGNVAIGWTWADGSCTAMRHDENVSCPVWSLLGKGLPNDTQVRLRGLLSKDEHGTIEIHPVYAMEILQDFNQPRPQADLTGVWADADVATYYLRQVGDTVWWLGLSADEGRTYANVFHGTVIDNELRGTWADIPLGHYLNSGALVLRGTLCLRDGCRASTPIAQDNLIGTWWTSNGIFGGRSLDKLYDAGR